MKGKNPTHLKIGSHKRRARAAVAQLKRDYPTLVFREFDHGSRMTVRVPEVRAEFDLMAQYQPGVFWSIDEAGLGAIRRMVEAARQGRRDGGH